MKEKYFSLKSLFHLPVEYFSRAYNKYIDYYMKNNCQKLSLLERGHWIVGEKMSQLLMITPEQ